VLTFASKPAALIALSAACIAAANLSIADVGPLDKVVDPSTRLPEEFDGSAA